ncbi:PPOX class F420-dependent oxidoreductase [Amycolatopsis viridis]|uniref:Pyridoxamine 5'-phosphate oxidase N-terminal domain-containing protein n=1 Tax=Amycolatopsis viridis TaxID=185678 RepID=A0ABX0SQR3_9PSEU|nr:PPOX class F420-dependent oxidoreductase [Amycolatopsis viridis]NIH79317.1 hypothetical protein [Amycolatopsis viridis]
MSEFERIAAEKFLLLTTFRKSGAPVPTPVWAAGDAGEIVVWSERTAGKVKRIRNNPEITVQGCDLRGNSVHGPVVRGRARILDDEATERVRTVIARKYGIVGRVTMFFSRLRGRRRTVGLAIRLAG